jgi:hypothetical protein
MPLTDEQIAQRIAEVKAHRAANPRPPEQIVTPEVSSAPVQLDSLSAIATALETMAESLQIVAGRVRGIALQSQGPTRAENILNKINELLEDLP